MDVKLNDSPSLTGCKYSKLSHNSDLMDIARLVEFSLDVLPSRNKALPDVLQYYLQTHDRMCCIT